ncbi:MAG TPA: hypothetical protein PKI01_00385 [Bacteroidales bacterium]|nr:hypothetical protein [Bacteroidales bacterium]
MIAIGTRSLSAPPVGGGGSPFIPACSRQAHEVRMNWIYFWFIAERRDWKISRSGGLSNGKSSIILTIDD